MAREDGPEIIIRTLINALRGIRRGATYQHSPQVYRGRIHLDEMSPGANEEIYVEAATDAHETRESPEGGSLAECRFSVELWIAIQDHARGPGGSERDTSEALNAFIRDVLRRIYARDWDAPSWSNGRGCIIGVNFPAIERYIANGSSLKCARVVCEVMYQDSNDFE